MPVKTIKDIELHNKAVLMRVDYNVSLKHTADSIVIADDTRIRQSLPTIQYILKQKPKRLVLMSHLGRPKGETRIKNQELITTEENTDFSLQPVAKHLEKELKIHVPLVNNYHLKDTRQAVKKMTHGEMVLLENVRFYLDEEQNDRTFAAQLAQLGDVFVNDAFGSSHRAHASVVGVAEDLPAVAGLLLAKELEMLDKVMDEPEHPFVAILGGAKATTKIPMIGRLMTKADYLLLGGGVANTFLKAFGYHIGHSIYSPESIRICQNLIWKATRVDTKLFLPQDLVVGSLASKKKSGVVSKEEIPRQLMALDIGFKAATEYAKIISTAKTIIWNGPMGANEVKPFDKGTEVVYQAIVDNKQAVSVVGGGDTLVSIKGHDHLNNITHVSTGGGAMLEYLEKGTLPGVEVLEEK